ncbi:Membrane associated serine protease, rhomboid family [Flavobacterium resistens]|uniref:Membrane associated serine protease, rhomboid family n=1 Tax=Flavobacterium resistens TaxID=443612 RepID=A0A521EQM8_9FLAO|nr:MULTISPECIES: rhomboid family intramembrane serine protease [Flavobacterium]MRX67803.1 rhomboid family intramembrane serine protease [Flavobacterium resistens]SMO85721.1 Membrane associated serine protease, rhomboid family [Flavobacterium resistens]
MMNITPVVKQLLIINIIFFIGSQLVPVSYDYLIMYFPENPDFKIWQIITHMFMHANLLHIAFNMFALYSFGSMLEHFWGGKKFLFFYISCGLGAALLNFAVNYYSFQEGLNILIANGYSKSYVLQLLSENQIAVKWKEILTVTQFENFTTAYGSAVLGASGAIYGLLTAFAFMFPNAELALMFIPIPIKAKYFVPGLLLVDLFLGLKGSSLFGSGGTGIAHFAHLGGAVAGFLMMLYWKKNQFNNNRWN